MTFKEIDVELAFQMQAQGNIIIDVREQHEWDVGHVAGASHYPKSQITSFKKKYNDTEKSFIIICQRGVRSKTVADYLVDLGYKEIYSVRGGLTAWEDAKLPTETD